MKTTVQVYKDFLQGTVIQRCTSNFYVERSFQMAEICRTQRVSL